QYLKDDNELNQFLLSLALDNATIVSGSLKTEGAKLEMAAKQYFNAQNVIKRESRSIDEAVLTALLNTTQTIDLSTQDNANQALQTLQGVVNDEKISLALVLDNEQNLIKITRQLYGNEMVSYLTQSFVESVDYQVLLKTAETLDGIVANGSILIKGEKQHPVESFSAALEILMKDAQKGMTIQRYKGLGEMNAEQLWETTMNPAVRRLLRVRIEDAMNADDIFATLMGDEVEPRRAFIEENALLAEIDT
ncbi:MAG: DNA gyrase subunit B, partial [Neisseriaceae bacterium]|nr:DNA gyrase subunit B [Neisseriaceae bacterium]